MKLRLLLLCSALLFASSIMAANKPILRLGVLAFGTTNWELSALKQQQLLANAQFQLDVHTLANPQAAKIALQSGSVDMIVTDWLWVSRMRETGADYTFYPYSDVSGALVVAQDSGIRNLTDLKGKRLGIAGDALDKNWLLLQALAAKQQLALKTEVNKVFGAPPLLNEQLVHHKVDALLNHWHYAAQLIAKGYTQLLSGREILQQLGITTPMPNLGYVFKHSFAQQHTTALTDFFNLTTQVRDKLCSDDKAWQAVVPLLKTEDGKVQTLLREGYCDSRVSPLGPAELAAAEQIYALLRKVSATQLTGKSPTIQQGTFWIGQ